jgi:hypothetical protein
LRLLRIAYLWAVVLPSAAQAQFDYTTNNGTLTLTHYIGPGGAVTIPATNNGFPVTSIGQNAFLDADVTSVSIPVGVTSIGKDAFRDCFHLNNVTIPNGVTNIGIGAFDGCSFLFGVTIPDSVTSMGASAFSDTGLTNVIVPDGLTNISAFAFYVCVRLTRVEISGGITSIDQYAFAYCSSLTNVTIPKSVTDIGDAAFTNCVSLTGIYFLGNAPTNIGSNVFFGDGNATAYYLPGATGWSSTLGGIPAVLWNPQAQTTDGSFGVRSNQFGFNITGTANIPLVVEASADLNGSAWAALQSCTLTNGSFYFSDPQWTNYPSRFYRFSAP